MRERKVVGFLKDPLDKVIFIVCSNYDYFHGKGNLFLRYVIFGRGIILDEPPEGVIKDLLDSNPNVPIIVLHGPCASCVRRGVIGPVGYGYPTDYSDPLDGVGDDDE